MIERPHYYKQLSKAIRQIARNRLRSSGFAAVSQDHILRIPMKTVPPGWRGLSASMKTSSETLKLEHIFIIYPGNHIYPSEKAITVWPLCRIGEIFNEL